MIGEFEKMGLFEVFFFMVSELAVSKMNLLKMQIFRSYFTFSDWGNLGVGGMVGAFQLIPMLIFMYV